MAAATTTKAKRWFPLESNPQVMNEYIRRMGIAEDAEFAFCDVYSTDDWALEMVLRPVLGVVMLFPIKPATEDHAKQERERIEKDGQIVSKNVYYMKQTVGNACGTVGILHALGNARDYLPPRHGSFLSSFFSKTDGKTPDEIAAILQADDEIEETHASAAQDGQSEQLEHVDDPINTHFVCFRFVCGLFDIMCILSVVSWTVTCTSWTAARSSRSTMALHPPKLCLGTRVP
ncbi:hypothetical protein, variant 1 [Aphanomyces astaci]|uniref:Ubiquitin carboxyl-terminal hydrolase n=1 Tax=Aphanomyces astaci TaxID=112090 RepID=W4GKX0_APHAT|nr:hypothetical protein, variant 1 [Aphanomyces astaci]ETV80340.1 hypothetical protein, variant 1 [Aphanomyces astaci]|eukprot:XP_009830264.1 hypothetical protein, variant 1 [Aphanomyces astaci]